jgi:hypothetical protein
VSQLLQPPETTGADSPEGKISAQNTGGEERSQLPSFSGEFEKTHFPFCLFKREKLKKKV